MKRFIRYSSKVYKTGLYISIAIIEANQGSIQTGGRQENSVARSKRYYYKPLTKRSKPRKRQIFGVSGICKAYEKFSEKIVAIFSQDAGI